MTKIRGYFSLNGENSLSENQLPIVVIACQVFHGLIEKFLPADLAGKTTFLDYGLHVTPKKLTSAIQEQVDQLDDPSLVLLGYGLCGNGLDGIRAGKHILLIPRADDCIAIFLGSYKDYRREFDSVPGTYYLTKGWLESGSNPLKEYQRYVEKYGQDTADWIMDQQYRHYKRLAFVAHDMDDIEKYRPEAIEVARYCQRWGMDYEEILGSDRYLSRLVEVAFALEKADGEFTVVPPGGVLSQSAFIRISDDR